MHDLECVYIANDLDAADIQKSVKNPLITDSSPKYSLRELFSVSAIANLQKLDLFHAPHYTLPYQLKMPSIVTIHDVIHLRMKGYYSFPKRAYAYMMIRHACASSKVVIVDSEFGKQELLSVCNIREEKIKVVPLGVHESYFIKSSENDKQTFKEKYKISKPFILYTGSLKPHKNIPVLLSAFRQLSKKHDIHLVFSGDRLYDQPDLHAFIESNAISNRVIDLGRIEQNELKTAYQSAAAVILPSLYEGFGFSMLEAMASGVPAIGARAASIPEVVGDAGMLFDPKDDQDLARCIDSILSNDTVKAQLIEKGIERAKIFSWKQCVENTLNIYREVVS